MIPPPPRATLFPYTTLFRSTEEQIERILSEISKTAIANAQTLARMAVEETGYGTVEHKTLKNLFCAEDRSEEHTSELQSQFHLVCRLLLEKKKFRTVFIIHN